MDVQPEQEAAVAALLHDQDNENPILFMETKKALIIFVRNPVLGKVKTRIAASIGDNKALAVYKHLLQNTKDMVSELDVIKHVFYADELNQNDLWNGNEKHQQTGDGLGQRMKNAFKYLFEKGYTKILIIGSDCYELTSDILHSAFEKLDHSATVIGPASDGGYYLLGMRSPYLFLFDNIKWSTDIVFYQTLGIIRENNLSLSLLPQLTDVDEAKDITFTY